jgi:hypothetical protein
VVVLQAHDAGMYDVDRLEYMIIVAIDVDGQEVDFAGKSSVRD